MLVAKCNKISVERFEKNSRVYLCFRIPLLASSFYIAPVSPAGAARRPIAEVSGTRVNGQDDETNSQRLVAQTRRPAA